MNSRLFLLLFPFLLLSSSCTHETPFDQESVKAVLMQQQEDWNRGDIEGFMQGYEKSDSTRFIGKNRVNYGWQSVLDSYRKGYPDAAAMGKLKFTILHIESLGPDKAGVTGRWELSETEKQSSGHFFLVLKNGPEGWKIIIDATS